MSDEKEKRGIFKKLFGKKSSCCSFELEEVKDEPEGQVDQIAAEKNPFRGGCCCQPHQPIKNADGNKKER